MNTYGLHERLVDIETKLGKSGQLTKCHTLFHKIKDHESDIEDDHYPFLSNGLYCRKRYLVLDLILFNCRRAIYAYCASCLSGVLAYTDG